MDISRYRLIDRIDNVSCDDGWIECSSTVQSDSELYEGHFPGFPLFPGTMQAEIVAQSTGFLALELNSYARMPVLIGINRSRFRRPLKPGEELVCKAVATYRNERMIVGNGEIHTKNGELVAAVEVQLGLIPFPNEQTQAALCGLAKTLRREAKLEGWHG